MNKYIVEFVGAFFLVFTICMVIVQPGAAALGFAPLAIGTVLAVMIFAGGHISGGHYNPAVSLAVFLRGKSTAADMLIYWVVQIVAALVAAFLAMYIKGALSAVTQAPVEVPTVDAQALMVPVLLVEFIFTFALCFTVLNVATAKGTSGNSFYGWAIGMAVLSGAYAVGAVSGGAFNPAVAVGLSQIGTTAWASIWIYLVAELLGGAVAALVFRAVNPADA